MLVFVVFNNNNNIYFASDSYSMSQGYWNSTITQKWLVIAQYRASVRSAWSNYRPVGHQNA